MNVAKEAMGKDISDKLMKGVGVNDVRKTFEYIVKSSKASLIFEWKRMKGLDAKNILCNILDRKKRADRKGQYVICGNAKRWNVKYDTSCKKIKRRR